MAVYGVKDPTIASSPGFTCTFSQTYLSLHISLAGLGHIGNAVIFGLSQELGLKGTQYNIALMIFFIPYILFEVTIASLIPQIMYAIG